MDHILAANTNPDEESVSLSVISSDDSIREKVGGGSNNVLHDESPSPSKLLSSRKEMMISRLNTSKQVDSKLKRMLTVDLSMPKGMLKKLDQ